MSIADVLLGAGAGAVSGGVVSYGAAVAIGRRAELGRERASSQRQLVGVVLTMRAALINDRATAEYDGFMSRDYVSEDGVERFAEEIIIKSRSMRRRTRTALLGHLERLTGAPTVQMAEDFAGLPLERRRPNHRQGWLLGRGIDLARINAGDFDQGILGRARKAPLIGDHVREGLAELDAMAALLN